MKTATPTFRRRPLVAALLVILVPGVSHATVWTWDGSSNVNANWGQVDVGSPGPSAPWHTNWTADSGSSIPIVNGDALVFTGSRSLANNNDLSSKSFSSITFDANAGAFTLSGNSIRVTAGGISNASSNHQTLNLPVVVAGNQTWDGGTAGMTFAGFSFYTNGNNSYTLSGNNVTIAGNISNASTARQTINLPILVGSDQTWDGAMNFNGLVTLGNHALALKNKAAIVSSGIDFNVGDSGTASLTLNSGASLSNKVGTLGKYAGNSGTVTVSDAGTTWSNSDKLYVGMSGTGVLNIANGGVVSNANGYLAYFTGSSGTATVTGMGSSWINNGDLKVGITGQGTLSILNGGTVSDATGYLGYIAGSSGSVTVQDAGSTWSNSGDLYLGLDPTAPSTLHIGIGGTVSVGNILHIGAKGVLNLDGGDLKLGSATVASGGSFTWSNGILELAGLTLGSSSLFGNNLNLNYGQLLKLSGALNLATGAVSVTSGATLEVDDGGSILGNVANQGIVVFNPILGNLSYDYGISGSGQLNKTGTGTLILTGTNSYSGGTNVSQGTLQIGNGGTTGSIQGDVNLWYSGASLSFDRSDDAIYSGTINGYGMLTKWGAGTLTLTGNNNFTGGTNINGGSLQVGDGVSGSLQGNIADYGQLIFNLGRDDTFSGNITGGGALIKLGGNTLTLTGANAYFGGTTISAGTLRIGDGNNYGSLSGNIVNNAQLSFNRADNVSFAGAISGIGNLSQDGAGMLTLTGFNSLMGGARINAGTLRIGNGGTTGSILGNINNNASLSFDRSDNVSFAGVISGNGKLSQDGAGMLTLTGNNSYTGGTRINTGTLQIGNGGSTGALVGNLVDNANLIFNRSDDQTFAGSITGGGNLTKTGAGGLSLADVSGYSGAATVLQGSLTFNSPGGSPIRVGSGGMSALNINTGGAAATSDALEIESNGVVNLNGGTLGADTISIASGGQFNWTAGALSLGSVTFGAAGGLFGNALTQFDLGPNRSLTVSNHATVAAGAFVQLLGSDLVSAGSIGNNGVLQVLAGRQAVAAGDISNTGTLLNSGTLHAASVTNSGLIQLSGSGNIVANTLNLNGGLVTGNALNWSTLGQLTGYGTVSSNIGGGTAANGIHASGGALILGNANSTSGYNFGGVLDVGSNRVVLLDQDQADLGASTMLAAGGRLEAGNGLRLSTGETLSFSGNASILGNFSNNGQVIGSGGTLTFLSDVKGAGGFVGNIDFHAAYNPGNSPALVDFHGGDATFDSTSVLNMEMFGSTRGSQYDSLTGIDVLTFNGQLNLIFGPGFNPSAGSHFDLFDFASLNGGFDLSRITVTGIDRNLLDFSRLGIDGTLSVIAVPAPVPETDAWKMLLIGLGLLFVLRRRAVG